MRVVWNWAGLDEGWEEGTVKRERNKFDSSFGVYFFPFGWRYSLERFFQAAFATCPDKFAKYRPILTLSLNSIQNS